jgi:hypothetical protein
VIEYPFSKGSQLKQLTKPPRENSTISFYVWAYPKIFKGLYPEGWSKIPERWEENFTRILDEVQSFCTDEELASMTVTYIGMSDRRAAFEYEIAAPMSKTRAHGLYTLMYLYTKFSNEPLLGMKR